MVPRRRSPRTQGTHKNGLPHKPKTTCLTHAEEMPRVQLKKFFYPAIFLLKQKNCFTNF